MSSGGSAEVDIYFGTKQNNHVNGYTLVPKEIYSKFTKVYPTLVQGSIYNNNFWMEQIDNEEIQEISTTTVILNTDNDISAYTKNYLLFRSYAYNNLIKLHFHN